MGDLGNIVADESGRAAFRIIDKFIQVQDVIGRSLAVTADADDFYSDGNSGER